LPFGPEDDRLGKANRSSILSLGHGSRQAGVARLHGKARQPFRAIQVFGDSATSPSQVSYEFGKVMGVLESPTPVNKDCLDRLFCCLLRIVAEIL
jgi:hypothetical protein